MLGYILRRVLGLIIVILLASMIAFFLMHAVPGGPFDELKMPLPEAVKKEILKKYGFDKPIWEQYLNYIWNALHGDFGVPFQSPTETVLSLIARVWPVTLQIGAVTIFLSFSIGILLGIISALKQNTWLDYLITTIATLGTTVPNFVIAIWLILFFSITLRWLPTGGWGEPRHFILPVMSYLLAPTAVITRFVKVNFLEELRKDYVRTARAKGLPEKTVIFRHVFKNALVPIITMLGPMIPDLATGSIFIEVTFRVPGLGKFFYTSALNRDYPMIVAMILLIAVLWGITYLITDIIYAYIDPRIVFT
ncbi:MAG: ABC transporter permease [Dictyoglomi bacterium]|jgi:ABC-type dipeptide/oligopeptide/nickel transport system permease component|nr:ABC transporter permease [Dictyoglomota bacterium]